jgi:lysophospholipase L1-like esterase
MGKRRIRFTTGLVTVILSTVFSLMIVEISLRAVYFQRWSTRGRFALNMIARKAISNFRTHGQGLDGKDLNRQAWEASYAERGLPIPAHGPREGYWGSRLGPKTKHLLLGWHEPNVAQEKYFSFDEDGIQTAGAAPSNVTILIIGGSVASGANASEDSTTYFERLLYHLAQRKIKARALVYAAGGWVSAQEVMALLYKGFSLRPDIILFLDGLNDLANIHDKPLDRRVSDFLYHMKLAKQLCRLNAATLVYVPQPFLLYKKTQSPIEKRIVQLSVHDVDQLKEAFDSLRAGLSTLAEEGVYLVDASDVLSGEQETTFADLWHFSDPGHELLARFIAQSLAQQVFPFAQRPIVVSTGGSNQQ